jgi:hypothetical protein
MNEIEKEEKEEDQNDFSRRLGVSKNYSTNKNIFPLLLLLFAI